MRKRQKVRIAFTIYTETPVHLNTGELVDFLLHGVSHFLAERAGEGQARVDVEKHCETCASRPQGDDEMCHPEDWDSDEDLPGKDFKSVDAFLAYAQKEAKKHGRHQQGNA